MNKKIRYIAVGMALAALCLMLLLLADWAGRWRANSVDAAMRAQLVSQAVTLADSLNVEQVRQLSFTRLDLESPAYHSIRQRMIIAGKSIPSRSIYSLARREGELFFGPENLDSDDPMASLPGDRYESPSPEFTRVFDSARARSFGPYTDAFGSFVSALAPVVCQGSGETLMVVGVDVLDKDWQAMLAGARRLPLMLAALFSAALFVCAVLVRVRVRMILPGNLPLRQWVLTPMLVASFAIVALFGAHELVRHTRERRSESVRALEIVRHEWERTLVLETRMLRALAERIAVSRDLVDSFRARDYDAVARVTSPLFRDVFDRYHVNQLYLFTPDRKCFLRAHDPDRRGDVVERETLLVAERTGESAWGIEFSATGMLMLRSVMPWRDSGELLGYIELGIDAGYLVELMAKTLGVDAVLCSGKEQLTQGQFEFAKAAGAMTGDWDDLPEQIVIAQTIDAPHDELAEMIADACPTVTETGEFCTIRYRSQTLECAQLQISDTKGRDAGRLYILRDITAHQGRARGALALLLALAGILCLGGVAMLWVITGTGERHMREMFLRVQEREAKYRLFADNITDVLWVRDLDKGEWIYVSPAVEAMLGYTVEEMGSLPLKKVLTETSFTYVDGEVEKNAIAYAENPGAMRAYNYELEHRRKDGTLFWAEISTRFIIGDNGSLCLLGITHDVTDRHHARQQIEASRRELEAVYTNAPVMMCLLDEQLRMSFANQALLQFIDKSEVESILGTAFETMGCEGAFESPGGCGHGKRCSTCVLRNAITDTFATGRNHRDIEFCTRLVSGGRRCEVTLLASTAAVPDTNRVLLCIVDITSRKRMEEDLRRNESRMRLLTDILQYQCSSEVEFLDYALDRALELTESAVGFIYYYDEECRTLTLNSWSRQVMEECRVAEPQTCYALADTGLWGDVVRQRRPIVINDYEAEQTLKKGYPEGHVKLVNYMSIPVFDGERIVGVVGVANKGQDYENTDVTQLQLFMDAVWKVTDRFKAREAMRESEERYRRLFEESNDAIFIHDYDGNILDVNRRACEMLGYGREKLLAMRIPDMHPEDEAAESPAQFAALLRDGAIRFETRLLTKRGDVLVAEVRSRVVDAESRVVQGIVRDVTQRKQAEIELSRFKTIFERANFGMAIAGSDGIVLYSNAYYAAIHGYEPEEVVGQDISIFHAEEDLDDVRAVHLSAINLGFYESVEVWHKRRSGERFPMLMNGVLVGDDEGVPDYIAATAVDITEQKRVEDALHTQLRLHQIVADISSVFTSVLGDSLDEKIHYVLNIVGDFLGADRCYMFRFSEERETMSNTHEWCAPGIPSCIQNIQNFPLSEVPWIAAHYRAGKPVYVPDVDELPAEADRERREFRKQGVQSVLNIPLMQDEQVVGLLGLDAVRKKREWSSTHASLLTVVGEIIANALARQKSLRALHESAERLMTVMNGIDSVVYVVDMETYEVLYLNDAGRRFRGDATGTICWQTLQEGQDGPCPFCTNDKLVDENGRSTGVYTWEHYNAAAGRWFDCRDRAIPWHDGRLVRLEVATDITERKETESALQLALAKYKTLFDTFPLGVTVADDSGKIVESNSLAARLLGLEDDAFSKRSIDSPTWEIIRPDGTPMPAGEYASVRALHDKRRIENVEMGVRKSEGDVTWISVNAAPLPIAGHGVVVTYSDITRRKRFEEELRLSHAELKKTIEERERALIEADRLAAEAQAATVAKSRFLATMSHEIRTPMNGVIGMTGLLLGTPLNDEQRRFAEIIRSSGEALLSLINDILDFSKIEADKLKLDVIDFDLRATVEDTAELMSLRAHEKGLDFVCHVAPGIHGALRGDPGRLRQILVNLVGNAVKFTEQGHVSVEVSEKRDLGASYEYEFRVQDTGIGIPEEKIAGLFQMFEQVDASTTRKFGGSGLGLAISKRLVHLMGGDISVESCEGKGSIFSFTVCFEKSARAAQPRPLPGAEVRGARVLLVESSPLNSRAVAENLVVWGARFVETDLGKQALLLMRQAALEDDPYKIVIISAQLSDMDGETLGRAIKEDLNLRDTPLVMMAEIGRRGDMAKVKEIGFSAYLTKPIKMSDLFECVMALLSSRLPNALPADDPVITRHSLHEQKQRSCRILLVEDNPVNRMVAEAQLARLGYKPDMATNGREGIAAMQQSRYDVVLMDVQMPEMDGHAATRAVRSGEAGALDPLVPIIAMTANALDTDRQECLDAGMSDYIAKPVQAEELREKIARWAGARHGEPNPC